MFDRTLPLRVAPAPSAEGFEREHLSAERPGLFSGLVEHWRALHTWSPQWFAERYAHVAIDTYRVREGALVFDPRTGLCAESITVADLVSQLLEGRATHRVRHRDFDRLPGLWDDAPPPALCAGRLRLEPNLWISAAGTRSQLHFDQPHTLLVQVYGSKRVLLFAPDERRQLYPHPPWSAIAQFSQVDVASPDFQRFPRLARAQGIHCHLAPGQALFIPGGWWHYLDSNEVTISVGFRWWPSKHLPRLLAADLYKRLRGHAR